MTENEALLLFCDAIMFENFIMLKSTTSQSFRIGVSQKLSVWTRDLGVLVLIRESNVDKGVC